jgi:hypothetical protein
LEWFPERAKKSDLLSFDYALVSGDDRLHEAVRRDQTFYAVTSSGRWRLYKTVPKTQE